jgi:hypothetical protein
MLTEWIQHCGRPPKHGDVQLEAGDGDGISILTIETSSAD